MKLASLMLPLLLVLAPAGFAADGPGPGETDPQKFVRLTRALEADPAMDKDKSMRSWLIEWASASPDVQVLVCDLMGPIPREKVPYGGELLTQYMFGNAAFQIEHPDRAKDAHSVQIAGIRSALKAYVAILKKDPAAKIPYFDDLRAKEKAGTLDAHLDARIDAACTKKE